ncbi:hypothetical protein [Sporosarcina sp. FSL W7-1283]|uniref:hypothetical protein n=1 Tax=Sporosarcina sp. FSL W7-1283 TaxID=2921560 RepID=UPI0030F7F093
MVAKLEFEERAAEVITEISNGTTKDELSERYEYSDYRSLDTFMRRRGYSWDKAIGNYVKREVITEVIEKVEVHSGKVKQIIDLFESGMDAKEVAKQLYFPSHGALADYMTSKGYVWSGSNYERETGIQQNGELVKEMTGSYLANGGIVEKIPRYLVPGILAPKNLNISHLLNQMLIDFSRQYNIRQREIFEAALIEFLQKYGYAHEIKALFLK